MKPSFHIGEAANRGVAGAIVWVLIAALSFCVSYANDRTGLFVLVYLFALMRLARAGSWRLAFYPGLATGLIIACVHLAFFYRIFSFGAAALWIVYAIWIAFFTALAWAGVRQVPSPWGWAMLPFLWVGLEYFRSELYYLRFSWLSPGYAFAGMPWQLPFRHLGVYGAGFVLASAACLAAFLWGRSKLLSGFTLLGAAGALVATGDLTGRPEILPAKSIHVAGIQMEFPTEKEVMDRLNGLVRRRPEVELVVLSEYTFDEPVPMKVREWCRKHRRYLVAGGKAPVPGGKFHNTAFVVGPDGEIVFEQVKAVPIQFFKDGLPAPEQKVWASPWGKLGICICYDLSYTRVTDQLVRLGAEALIVPTMDVADWGGRQHTLHARIAPVRAAEYGLPILRVASSGISQHVDEAGVVLAAASCPGEGEVIEGVLRLAGPGSIPLDRGLAPLAVAVTLATALFLVARGSLRMTRRRGHTAPASGVKGPPKEIISMPCPSTQTTSSSPRVRPGAG
jgi:apolipoprotein N-acyltransferase